LEGPSPQSGKALRHHLEDISEEADVVDRLLQDRVPRAGQHVWDWFYELRLGSIDGMSNAITYQDIYQWSKLMKIKIAPWEARALVAMGLAFMDETSKLEGEKKDAERS
jgi:hypothetical protein